MKRLATFSIACALLAVAAPAIAKKKDKPAKSVCNGGIPVVLGNVWTYKSGKTTVLIRIADIKSKDGKTLVSVEEKTNDRALSLTWTCTKEGMTVPADSFFFVGEPGGGAGDTLTEKSHDGVTFPKDLKVDTAFVEKVTGEVARTDVAGGKVVHPPATVEIERHVLIEKAQPIEIGMGKAEAIKVGFELRGRSTVGAEKIEFAIKRPGTAWIMPGLGVLKMEDANDHTYELIQTTIPFSKE